MNALDDYMSMLDSYSNIPISFGDWVNFFSAYKLSYNSDFGIYKILQFPPSEVHTINLDNTFLSLIKKRDGALEKDSIDIEEPYRILNLDNEVLYTVSDHNGYFGTNLYDKYLIDNSGPLGIYILQYVTYIGPKLKIILVDNSYKNISLSNFDTFISKQIDTSVDYRNKNSIYISSDTYFKLYYLPKVLTSSISISSIINNSEVQSYTSNSNNVINLFPEESGWLVFERDELYIDILSSNGKGIDRFIKPFSNQIYYVVIGDEYNKSFLNRLKGITSFQEPTIQIKINV